MKHCILGISGSLRNGSNSTAILNTLAEATADRAEYDFAEIGSIPHFNQDLCAGAWPEAAAKFCAQVTAADALVITSAEYNHGMPGVLKNALEWASRPHNASPLRNKPALIITSSPAFTGGVRAQYQIRETLVSALARPVNTPEIVIGGVGAKIVDGRLCDETVLQFALAGFDAMFAEIALLNA